MKREVGSYDEDSAEAARFGGDGVGLPESPISSNYPKNLRRAQARHGLVQPPDGPREGASGGRPTQAVVVARAMRARPAAA